MALAKGILDGQELDKVLPKPFFAVKKLNGNLPKPFLAVIKLNGDLPKPFLTVIKLNGNLPKPFLAVIKLNGNLPKPFLAVKKLNGNCQCRSGRPIGSMAVDESVLGGPNASGAWTRYLDGHHEQRESCGSNCMKTIGSSRTGSFRGVRGREISSGWVIHRSFLPRGSLAARAGTGS